MNDASNRVEFVNPGMLLVETVDPFPFRFRHIVMIMQVARRHGGQVKVQVDGHEFDASSAFEIIQSMGSRSSAYVGPEAALIDLSRLLRILLIDGKPEAAKEAFEYLR